MTEAIIPGRGDTEAFRFVLRRATRAEHEALDSHPAFSALMDGTLSIRGYGRLMEIFHAFYARHDGLLGHACSQYQLDRIGFEYASRTEILRNDLAALGIESSPPGARGPASLPPIQTAATAGGILYVLEGSMLGGSVLARAVDGLLSRSNAKGQGYWQWCRDAGASRWAMTCAAIERLASNDATRTEMIAGARGAFLTFAAWLSGWSEDVEARNRGVS